MLSKAEIAVYTTKQLKDVTMSNPQLLAEVEHWDFGKMTFRPQLIEHIYVWMKSHYKQGNTLEDMVNGIGMCPERISHALKLLEFYGYLTITRTHKPFLYRVVK